MANKKRYYRLTNILKHKAQYNVLLGQKSNGKSYAIKEHVLMKAYHNISQFVYMRRYQMDVKTSDVEFYFSDMPIYSITNGEYTCVVAYRNQLYFGNFDEETCKVVKGPVIGRYVYLSGYNHFNSQAFPGIGDIVYEEFVTDSMYIDNEPTLLQKFVSTIARDNPDVQVWMIGNTISRVCPYFEDWQLRNIPRQKPGTIDEYRFTRFDEETQQEIETLIAVEYCESNGSVSGLFFGKAAEHITGGQWQTREMPKMPGKRSDYAMLYELVLSDIGFNFVLQLMCDPYTGGQFVFVYPHSGRRQISRKITNVFSADPLTTTSLNVKIKAEEKMRELINSGKICYSDNLTGSDFENVLNNRKGVL